MKTLLKKTLSYSIIAVLAVSVMVSCKKSDDTTPSSDTVVGNWQLKSLTADPAIPIFGSDLTVLLGTCASSVTFKLNSDGTITPGAVSAACKTQLNDVGADASTFSKWSVSGSKITITETDKTTTTFDLELSGSTMKWKQLDATTKSTFTLTFTKI
ncbi:MAG: lipocalin family protein [Spirosomataceae bacterium]